VEVDGCTVRRAALFGVVAFFFVVGEPRIEAVIVEESRWVPGPGAYLVEVVSGWPGRAKVGMDIVVV